MTNTIYDTDLDHFLNTLDAGTVRESLEHLLSHVSANVIDQSRKGQIVLTIDLERIDESYMVKARSKLKYTHPTGKQGERSETAISTTPYYVGQRGKLTFTPDTQGDLKLFGQDEETKQ